MHPWQGEAFLPLRKDYHKLCKALPIAFDADVTLMGFYNGLCDGQAQTVTAILTVSGRITSIKTFKDMLLVFRGNSFSRVAYQEHFFVTMGRKADPDGSMLIGIFKGIIQQDGD